MILALLLFLGLAAYQLHLPGLHYDEAKEAGLNAMQLLLGQPVTAFRDATLQIGPWRMPLMVQDYIGALNVVLAVPFLAVGGINPVALRWLPLTIAVLTLICTWQVARRLGGTAAAIAAVWLLAVNPSFVFWSRQGIFVTNLTALLFMASLWTGLRWWQGRRPCDLWLTAFLWGLGIYAKLLFVWAIGAVILVAVAMWLLRIGSWRLEVGDWRLEVGDWRLGAGAPPAVRPDRVAEHPERSAAELKGQSAAESKGRSGYPGKAASFDCTPFRSGCSPQSSSEEKKRPGHLHETRLPPSALTLTLALASISFLLPLTPLILFNLRTGGTLISVFGNLGRSYYGVDNSAYLANLGTRLTQVVALLRGDHFWYLGERYANPWAVWLAVALVALGLLGWAMQPAPARRQLPPFVLTLALLALMVAQSAFTVSDLFITHYAILLPLVPLTAGLAFGVAWQNLLQVGYRRLSSALERTFSLGRRRIHSAMGLLALLALLAWIGSDAWTTLRYHRVLSITGGYGAHSEAIGRLAAYLDEKGYTAPVMLDWGIDAPVRFLSAGRVNPIEVFGYDRLDAPDPGFADRVARWLDDSNAVFVGPAPEKAVFRGRVEAMAALASQHNRLWLQEAWFMQRSGEVLYIIYRTIPQG